MSSDDAIQLTSAHRSSSASGAASGSDLNRPASPEHSSDEARLEVSELLEDEAAAAAVPRDAGSESLGENLAAVFPALARAEAKFEEVEATIASTVMTVITSRVAWFRLLSLTVLLVLLLLLGILPISASDSRSVTGSLSSSAALLSLDVDKCKLHFSPISSSSSSLRVSVDVRPASTYVSLTSTSLTVRDTRELGARYSNYNCEIHVGVPQAVNLPSTTILVSGYQTSSISATGVSWAPTSTLRIELEDAFEAGLQMYFTDTALGSLVVDGVDNGHIQLVDASLASSAELLLAHERVTFLARLKHSVIVTEPLYPDSNHCLTSVSTTCDPDGASSRTCQLRYMDESETLGGSTPTITITGSTAARVQIMAADVATNPGSLSNLSPETFSNLTSTVPANANSYSLSTSRRQLGLSTRDAAIIKSAAGDADRSTIYVEGSGAPEVAWTHARVKFYVTVPPAFTDLFTWSLLTPVQRTINTTLAPGFCPGLHWLGRMDVDALGERRGSPLPSAFDVRDLLRTTMGSDFGTLLFSDPSDINSWTGGKFHIRQSTVTGQSRVSEVTLRSEGNILATIVFNVIVSAVSAMYFMYVIVRRLFDWATESLDEWGTACFGAERWGAHRHTVLNQASLFFWSEFIIGFPSETTSYLRLFMSVVMHLIVVILLPIFPTALATTIYFSHGLNSDDAWHAVLAYLLFVLCIITLILGSLMLVAYYLQLSVFRSAQYLAMAHEWSTALVGGIGIAYLVNVMFWIVLGVAVKPNEILPIAAVILVLAITVSGTVRRVLALKDLLDREVAKHGRAAASQLVVEEVDNDADGSVKIADVKKMGVKDVFAVLRKSEVLEMRNVTIRERIAEELAWMVILLSLLGFLGLGFFVLSTDSQLVSALTSAIVFLVGGSVNVPLIRSTGAQREGFIDKLRVQAIRNNKKTA